MPFLNSKPALTGFRIGKLRLLLFSDICFEKVIGAEFGLHIHAGFRHSNRAKSRNSGHGIPD